ncbi:MAG TPA: LPS assembly protein LptD [Candidatus Acidoferrum sp.]
MTRRLHRSTISKLRFSLFLAALFLFSPQFPVFAAQSQRPRPPASTGGIASLTAKTQSRQGDVTIGDGDVDITYQQTRLRTDHIEYNDQTNEIVARGHIQFDYDNQHLDADEAHYNVRTGHGTFTNVRGNVTIERHPNPSVLLTQNPLHFEAAEVERLDENTFVIRHAWITVCDPAHPTWTFYAPQANIHLNKNVALINANFRLLRIPLLYFPYATAPVGRNVRQTGFLLPEPTNSSSKGFVFGDAFYWAPTQWLDATMGAQYLSRRGNSERGTLRAKPWENTTIKYSYYGVNDHGLPGPNGIAPEGGQEQQLEVQSLLPKGWRFVTDYNELSSLTFRLAFADTFGDAINSEVRSSFFLTNNFRGFSLNFAALNDKTFLSLPTTTTAPTSVSLRTAPEARFSSVEQAPFRNVPVYFGFDTFEDAVHRSDENINTGTFVQRTEFAPRVTIPLHFGPWVGLTTTAAFRSTYYGDSLSSLTTLTGQSITENTGEFTIDLRPPALERFVDRNPKDKSKLRKRYKHVIEPDIAYRYVTGIHNFADIIRFDEGATLTDTNELQYGLTQRLWVKQGDEQPVELVSWRVSQKHFFDPNFGGALVPGTRNVFETFEEVSPFAFADGPRTWSPVVSDVQVTPGGRYDFEQILEYDTQRGRLTTIGNLAKIKPYKEFFLTLGDFRLKSDPTILQPTANQVRALVGYGELNRKGFNFTSGISYDFTNSALQNQLIEVSYNGGCCGIALEYRRIALGQIRTDNRFSASFIIANIGTFGNLRHREKIF